MKKKLIALLLTLVMVVSVLPINVFAAEHEAGKATFDYLFEKYGSLIKDKTGDDNKDRRNGAKTVTKDRTDTLAHQICKLCVIHKRHTHPFRRRRSCRR